MQQLKVTTMLIAEQEHMAHENKTKSQADSRTAGDHNTRIPTASRKHANKILTPLNPNFIQ